MDLTHSKKILWAVDPSEENTDPQVKVAEIIKYLRWKWPNALVKPVYVLGPADLNLSTEFTGPWLGPYLPAAERALDHAIGQLGITDIEKPEIITRTSTSSARAADALVEHAVHWGADMILVGSHGRKGLSRLLVGSFSETLLLRSSVPVLVAGAHSGTHVNFERILFPTDFSEGSKDAFRSAVEFATVVGAEMTLFHAIEQLNIPIYPSGVYALGTPWMPIADDLEDEKSRRARRLNAWSRWSSHCGVSTRALIEYDVARVAHSIIDTARKLNVGWITMASHSGAVASALLGSVTREVVRAAECPVWVVRYEEARTRRRRAA